MRTQSILFLAAAAIGCSDPASNRDLGFVDVSVGDVGRETGVSEDAGLPDAASDIGTPDSGLTGLLTVTAYSYAEGSDFEVRWNDTRTAFGTFRGELVFDAGTDDERRLESRGGTDVFVARYEAARLMSVEHWGGSGDDGVLEVTNEPGSEVIAGWFTDELTEDIGGMNERSLSGTGLQLFQRVESILTVVQPWPFAGLPPENVRTFDYSRFGILVGGYFDGQITLPSTSGPPIELMSRGGRDLFAVSYRSGLPPLTDESRGDGTTSYVQIGGPEDDVWGDAVFRSTGGGFGTWDWARGFAVVGSFPGTAEVTGTAPTDPIQSNGDYDGFIYTLPQSGGTGAPGLSTIVSYGGSGQEHFLRARSYQAFIGTAPVYVYGTFDSPEPVAFGQGAGMQMLTTNGRRDIVILENDEAGSFGTLGNDEIVDGGFLVGSRETGADVLQTPDGPWQLPFAPASVADLEGPRVALGSTEWFEPTQLHEASVADLDGSLTVAGVHGRAATVAWDELLADLPSSSEARLFVAQLQRRASP